MITNLERQAILLATVETVEGVTMIGIPNYENAQGEISNYRINLGINYLKVMQDDMKNLIANKKNTFETLLADDSLEDIETCYNTLFKSLEKRLASEEQKEILRANNDKTINASDGQKDAFTTLEKGIKEHNVTKKIYIEGLQISKTVIKPIEYKPTNSKDSTILQNKIKKLSNFREKNYKRFSFEKGTIKIKGLTI